MIEPMLINLTRVNRDATQVPPCPDCCAGVAIRVAPLDGPDSETVWDLVRLHEENCPYANEVTERKTR